MIAYMVCGAWIFFCEVRICAIGLGLHIYLGPLETARMSSQPKSFNQNAGAVHNFSGFVIYIVCSLVTINRIYESIWSVILQ